MGCGASLPSVEPSAGVMSRRSEGACPCVTPITIPEGARRFNPSSPNIILVFGGVGSDKGEVLDLLVARFGFHLISMEALLLQVARSLPPAAGEEGGAAVCATTREALQRLKEAQGFGMEQALVLVHEAIAALGPGKRRRVVVDVLPSHADMLQGTAIFKGGEAVAQLMASDAAVLSAGLALHLDHSGARAAVAEARTTARRTSTRGAGGKVADEANPDGRRQRSQLLCRIAEPFIAAFRAQGRLVVVNSSQPRRQIVAQAEHIFAELGYPELLAHTVHLVRGLDPSLPPGSALNAHDLELEPGTSGSDVVALVDGCARWLERNRYAVAGADPRRTVQLDIGAAAASPRLTS